MFAVRRLTDAIAAILTLIGLYLVLDRSTAVARIFDTLFQGGGSLAKILQGR